TPSIRAQTDGGLAPEQAVRRFLTCTEVKTAFQYEHSLEAITQIFCALQAPAIALANAVDQAGALPINALAVEFAVNLLVTDTTIKDNVHRNRRFGMGCAGETCDQSSGKQALLHECISVDFSNSATKSKASGPFQSRLGSCCYCINKL